MRRPGFVGPTRARSAEQIGGPPVNAGMTFEYLVLRIVPRVDRGEYLNGAVLLYCRKAGFLDLRVRTSLDVLSGLAPDCDAGAVQGLLEELSEVTHGAGAAGELALGARFRWLAAPRSSSIQPGPIHTGITLDPQATLERLAERLL